MSILGEMNFWRLMVSAENSVSLLQKHQLPTHLTFNSGKYLSWNQRHFQASCVHNLHFKFHVNILFNQVDMLKRVWITHWILETEF